MKKIWIFFWGFTFLCIVVPLCIAGTLTYQYDNLNRIIRVEKAGEYYIEYSYDAAGNRSQVGTILQMPALDHDADGDFDGEDLYALSLTGPSASIIQSFALRFGLNN